MSLQRQNLQKLLNLAHEASSEKRRELLAGVTNLFFVGDADMNDTESALAGDILEQVWDQVAKDVRVELSQRLSATHQASPSLIKKLAYDIIEVARPVLMKSEVLSDEHLQDIVGSMGSNHQLAVSKRETVSEAVSDALIENGNEDVLISLLQNDGSRFTRRGIEWLVEKSEKLEELQSRLLQREDLPPDLMQDMFWFVDAALKRVITEKSWKIPATIDENEVERLLIEREAAFRRRCERASGELSGTEKHIRRMARMGKLDHQALIRFLKQDAKEEFIAALAYLTDIDLDTAEQITNSPTLDTIAIACRAIEFEYSMFTSLALLLNKENTIGGQEYNPGEIADLLELYNNMPFEVAKRTMRFWRVRKKSSGGNPRAPL